MSEWKWDFKRSAFVGGTLSMAALFAVENYSLETEREVISSEKITEDFDGFRIVHLSDLHCRSFGMKNRRLIKKIKKLRPDIVVMTGDMVSRQDRNFEPFFNLVRGIAREFPTYYTIGNHELDLTDRQLSYLFSSLRGLGVQVLSNDRVIITRGKSAIELYGMWYALNFYKKNGSYRHHDKFTISDMRALIGNAPSRRRFSIVLAHNPLDFRAYSEWGADLILSGHVHGGGIRLGKLGGVFSPGRRFFPEYYQGRYSIGKTDMVVSRGLGGLRLMNRPQIVEIKLERKTSDNAE